MKKIVISTVTALVLASSASAFSFSDMFNDIKESFTSMTSDAPVASETPAVQAPEISTTQEEVTTVATQDVTTNVSEKIEDTKADIAQEVQTLTTDANVQVSDASGVAETTKASTTQDTLSKVIATH